MAIFDKSGGAVLFIKVDDGLLSLAKNPPKHVKEMDPYIRRYPTRFLNVPLPRDVIPAPATREVGEVYVINLLWILPRFPLDSLPQRQNAGVVPKLQDTVDATSTLVFDFF